MGNEIRHYSDIKNHLVEILRSNFKSLNCDFIVEGFIGELSSNLQNAIENNLLTSEKLDEFSKTVPPLNLDIFILILNNVGNFELVVCEIKDVNALGLAELSQLIGYNLISNARFGLLINVDGGLSKRFASLLHNETYLTNIMTLKNKSDPILTHRLGVMRWDSLSKRLEQSTCGSLKSLSELSNIIAKLLNK